MSLIEFTEQIDTEQNGKIIYLITSSKLGISSNKSYLQKNLWIHENVKKFVLNVLWHWMCISSLKNREWIWKRGTEPIREKFCWQFLWTNTEIHFTKKRNKHKILQVKLLKDLQNFILKRVLLLVLTVWRHIKGKYQKKDYVHEFEIMATEENRSNL